MIYPTTTEVLKGTPVDLVRWNRTLPSPRTEKQLVVINLIVKRLNEVPSNERVHASKEVGWDVQ